MFEHLKNGFLLKDERLQKYAPLFKRIDVPAKTILLKERHVSKKAYWIEKGCMRDWFNKNRKDITYQFIFEGSTVASIERNREILGGKRLVVLF